MGERERERERERKQGLTFFQSSAESCLVMFSLTSSPVKTVSLLLTDFTKHGPINTINELKAILSPVVKGNPNKYFAQVFQALRMAVNEETESLSDLLNQAASLVKPGGRIVVITFHSIEDRIVKNYLRHGNQLLLEKYPIYGTLSPSPFELVNKKPIEPSVEEVKRNPRSRSARLRVAVKK